MTKSAQSREAGQPAPASPAPRRPRGRPRQLPLEEQRERILAAATSIFVSEGLEGATSERIAEVSGVGRTSVYQIFGTKNDVFVAAVERAMTRTLDQIRRSLASTESYRGRKQAQANIGAYFELVTREPETFRMMQLAERSGDNETREAALALRRRLQDAVAAYIVTTWEGFRDLDARDANLAATIIAAVGETAAAYHLERPDRSTEEMVQFVADFVWSGVYDLAVGHDIPAGRKGAAAESAARKPG